MQQAIDMPAYFTVVLLLEYEQITSAHTTSQLIHSYRRIYRHTQQICCMRLPYVSEVMRNVYIQLQCLH